MAIIQELITVILFQKWISEHGYSKVCTYDLVALELGSLNGGILYAAG
jgi:hypothetical protein